jgi:predicted HAD superfamily phosphohydrolase YqeG
VLQDTSCIGETRTLFRTVKKLTCKAFRVVSDSKETLVACAVGPVTHRYVTEWVFKVEAVRITCAISSNNCKMKVVINYLFNYLIEIK